MPSVKENPITLSPEIHRSCPQLRLGLCRASGLQIRKRSLELNQQISWAQSGLLKSLNLPAIPRIKGIAAARAAYKALGKEPGRYRPSAEALIRRVVSGKELYAINNVVDIINLVSMRYGFSIGGYDTDKINGSVLLKKGGDEPYEAIGRGNLNIAHLPVLYDEHGPFGNPTSDSERCKIDMETQQLWLVMFDFDSSLRLSLALQEIKRLLNYYTQPEKISTQIIETPK